MLTHDFESILEEARRFNERLDARLTQTGSVDARLFADFAAVESDPNASSVGWLNAKLLVLAARLSGGGELWLFEPSQHSTITVRNISELVAWADKHFPVIGFGEHIDQQGLK